MLNIEQEINKFPLNYNLSNIFVDIDETIVTTINESPSKKHDH